MPCIEGRPNPVPHSNVHSLPPSTLSSILICHVVTHLLTHPTHSSHPTPSLSPSLSQVCVLENGLPLLDLSAGLQSPYNGRPVGPDTLFNCFSVTKGVAAGAVHNLAER